LSQDLRAGEPIEEALVIGDDGLRARLLQHHLGNQNAVRIFGGAPGQRAMLPLVPILEKRGKAQSWIFPFALCFLPLAFCLDLFYSRT
jgi:hypothetical protein